MSAATEAKLREARADLARAEAAFDQAEGRAGVPNDPGALSGIRRTNTARQAQQATASIDRTIEASKALTAAQDKVHALEHRLDVETREAAQNAAATVDLDSLQPGDLIRYEQRGRSLNNWARVVRVNAKTVTCGAGAPGMDQPKIQRDKIVETRKAART